MKELINHQQVPLVAMTFMNEVHFEDVEIINELYRRVLAYPDTQPLDATAVDEQFALWYDHTVEHFKGEEEAMLSIGFPPYPMHKGAHDEKLQVMKQVQSDWLTDRDIDALRNYLEVDLVNWITNHIQTMDRVTAMFLQQVNS